MKVCSSNLMQFVFPMTPHSAIMCYVIVKQIMIARSPNALVVPVKQFNKYNNLEQWVKVTIKKKNQNEDEGNEGTETKRGNM